MNAMEQNQVGNFIHMKPSRERKNKISLELKSKKKNIGENEKKKKIGNVLVSTIQNWLFDENQ